MEPTSTATATPPTGTPDPGQSGQGISDRGPLGMLGEFPVVNLQMITDYARPKSHPLRQVFRLHMDIPIEDETKWTNLDDALAAKQDATAYKIVKSLVPGLTNVNRRAHAVLDAALKP